MAQPNADVISLKRTIRFGACPASLLRIDSSGAGTFSLGMALQLAIVRLRAALRDKPLKQSAIRNGSYPLFLIYIENPSTAIRALREHAAANASPERQVALQEDG